MNKIIFVFTMIVSSCAFGQYRVSDTQYFNNNNAFKTASRALYSIPEIKAKMKYFESKLWYYIPLDKDSAAFVGGVTNTLVQGRFSTRSIKNMNMDFFGGQLRADFQYDFKKNSSESFLNCIWDI